MAASSVSSPSRSHGPRKGDWFHILLRPAFARGYSGRELLGDQGAGVVFGAAWTFKVR